MVNNDHQLKEYKEIKRKLDRNSGSSLEVAKCALLNLKCTKENAIKAGSGYSWRRPSTAYCEESIISGGNHLKDFLAQSKVVVLGLWW